MSSSTQGGQTSFAAGGLDGTHIARDTSKRALLLVMPIDLDGSSDVATCSITRLFRCLLSRYIASSPITKPGPGAFELVAFASADLMECMLID